MEGKTDDKEGVSMEGSKLAAARQGEPRLIRYLQADALTRQMVVDFVDCVYVYNDKSIHIEWSFSEKGEKNEPA